MSVFKFIMKSIALLTSCVVIVKTVEIFFGVLPAYGTALFLAMYVVPQLVENHF